MAEEKNDDHKQDELNSEFQNFQRLLKGALSAPKEELDKRRGEYEQAKERRKRNKR